MEPLTKKQRILAYKSVLYELELLKAIKNHEKLSMCSMLCRRIKVKHDDFSEFLVRDVFPEFLNLAYKYQKLDKNWFPLNDVNSRIKVLKECIKNCKSSIK